MKMTIVLHAPIPQRDKFIQKWGPLFFLKLWINVKVKNWEFAKLIYCSDEQRGVLAIC